MARVFIRILFFLTLAFSTSLSAAEKIAPAKKAMKTQFSPMLQIVPSSTTPIYISPAEPSPSLTYTVTNKSRETAHQLTVDVNKALDTNLVDTLVSADSCSGQNLPSLGSTCHFTVTLTATGASGTTLLAPQVCKSNGALCSVPNASDRVEITTIPVAAPSIATVSPSSGSHTGGTTVTITGQNLQGATSVKFGDISAAIQSNSDTKLVVTTGASGSSGPVTVTVVTPRGTANDSNGYTYNPIVTASAGTGGTVSPSGSVMVNYLQNQTFTATPAAGYVVDHWLYDGTSPCGTSTTCVLSNVTTDHTLIVNFSTPEKFTVTPSAGAGGTILPNTQKTVSSGGSLLFTATPTDSSYAVSGWTVSNSGGTQSICGTNTTCNLTNITENTEILVSFSNETFTVTPSAGTGGQILPSTTQNVHYNASQSFSALPNTADGYTVSGWTVNGSAYSNCGTNITCNVTNITQNTTVAVSFVAADVTGELQDGSCVASFPSTNPITCNVVYTNHTSNVIPNPKFAQRIVSGSGSITNTPNQCGQLDADGGTCTQTYTFTPAPSSAAEPEISMSIKSSTEEPLATVNHTVVFTNPLTVYTALTCDPNTVVASSTADCSVVINNAGPGATYIPSTTPTTGQGTIINAPGNPTVLANALNTFHFTYTAPSSVGTDTQDTINVGYSDNWANSLTIEPTTINLISAVTASGIRCYPEPGLPNSALNCNLLLTNVTGSSMAIPVLQASIGGVTVSTTNNCSGTLASNTPCTVSFSRTLPSNYSTSTVTVSVAPASVGVFPTQTATVPVYPTTIPNIQSNPLVCDDAQLAFGGSTTTCSVTFRNLGVTTATGVSLSGSATLGSISSPVQSCSNGGSSMAQNDTCSLTFTYTPPASGPDPSFAEISVNYSDTQNSVPAFLNPFTILLSTLNTGVTGQVSSSETPATNVTYTADGTLQVLFNFTNQTGSNITFGTPEVFGVVDGQAVDLSYAIDTNEEASTCLANSTLNNGAGCNLQINFTPYQFNGFKTGDQILLTTWLPLLTPSTGISSIGSWEFSIGEPTIFTDVLTNKLFVSESGDPFTGALLFGNGSGADLTNVRAPRVFLPAGYSTTDDSNCSALITPFSPNIQPCSGTTLASDTYCYICFNINSGFTPTPGTTISFEGQLSSDESIVTAQRLVPVTPSYRTLTLDNECPSPLGPNNPNPITGEPVGTVWPAFVSGAAYYFCSQDSDCPLNTKCYVGGHQCMVPASSSGCTVGGNGYQLPADFPGGSGCSEGCNAVPSACPTYSTCKTSSGLCYWSLPEATTPFGTAVLTPGSTVTMQLPNSPLTKAGNWSTVWSGGLVPRTGCHVVGTELECDTGYCPVADAGTDNSCTAGPLPPVTQAEFTFLYNNQDYYDVEIINGFNIPMSMKTTNTQTLDPDSPYVCNVTGETIPPDPQHPNYPKNQCSWNFTMNTYDLSQNSSTAVAYTAEAKALHTLVPDGGGNCTPGGSDCDAPEVCGLSQQYSTSITTAPHFTCGAVVGFWSSNQLCGNNANLNYAGLDCSNTYSSGIPLSGWFGCNQGSAQNSCYSANGAMGCCGCPYWSAGVPDTDEPAPTTPIDYSALTTIFNPDDFSILLPNANNDYCKTTAYSSTWMDHVFGPSLIWMKQGCSSLYTFPYDDATSTFVCSSNSLNGGQVQDPAGKINTQNYTITFCPGGHSGQVNGNAVVVP